MFSDFFNWVNEVVSFIFNFFQNLYNGVIALYTFVFEGWDFITNLTALLPAILGSFVFLGFLVLIIKFVLGR